MNDTSHTSSLVSSSDVNGTAVYGTDGAKVGDIHHLMIGKESGQITYAVMGFGGFLGMGEEHHPIPWQKLSYDADKHGYTTDINESQLKGAPKRSANWDRDRGWEQRTYDHYSVPYYW